MSVDVLQPSQEILDIESTTMWWAGKEILREQKMGDRVGKNEKTKIVVKLQKKGQGAPSREPLIDQKNSRRNDVILPQEARGNEETDRR
mmetsp:Transcript_43181/g.111966  ORF Transcript_43181/g.111966 Transcript_43181/m.111966 type:complete len:89 (+) Transcript_43181:1015-1281(+)